MNSNIRDNGKRDRADASLVAERNWPATFMIGLIIEHK
jgi:hypothetical protein